MRIYTRAEIGLKPPIRPIPHCRKKFFVIHHTASPNVDGRTFEQDAAMQRMWQDYHMRRYSAKDILNTFSVMRSGRILEGRMPWDSDGGAAINAGSDGFGIENEGTYYDPGVYMEETQYRSLVWLCAEAHKRVGVPLVFKGHKEIWGNSTACPGNLMEQFITDGKLKRDVQKLLKPEKPKEGAMLYSYPETNQVEFIDCYQDRYNYFVITDGTTDHLIFTLEDQEGHKGTTDGQKVSGLHCHNMQDILRQERMKDIQGSYKLIVICNSHISIGIREVPK